MLLLLLALAAQLIYVENRSAKVIRTPDIGRRRSFQAQRIPSQGRKARHRGRSQDRDILVAYIERQTSSHVTPSLIWWNIHALQRGSVYESDRDAYLPTVIITVSFVRVIFENHRSSLTHEQTEKPFFQVTGMECIDR